MSTVTCNISFEVSAAELGEVMAALGALKIKPNVSVQTEMPEHSSFMTAQPAPTASVTAVTTPSTAPPTVSAVGKCAGLTKKGEPCKNSACKEALKHGKALCSVHYKA